MATIKTKTRAFADEALRLVDEIVSREKCSRTSVLKRLGFTGGSGQDLLFGAGCTEAMLERVQQEHIRVCALGGKPPRTMATAAAAEKAGLTVAPRDDSGEEEPEEDDAAEPDDSGEEPEEEDAEEGDGYEDNEGDDRRRSPRPVAPRAQRTVTPVSRDETDRALFGKPAREPIRIRQQAETAPRTELHRAADVIAALGGIESAEALVPFVRAIKGVL